MSLRTSSIALSMLALAMAAFPVSAAESAPVAPTARTPKLTGWKATPVVDGLEFPWAIAWLPDGSALITERPGRLRVLRDGAVSQEPVAGLPGILASGQGGLMDVSLHPRFAENKLVYLTYSTGTRDANYTAVGRGRLEGNELKDFRPIFENPVKKSGGQHFGSRILWLPDGTMLVSIGDGGNPPTAYKGEHIRKQAQSLANPIGKVVRLTDDGGTPPDNPFVGKDGADGRVWTLGHRNIQGLAMDAAGNIWASEHGARGGDELNLLKSGTNYGWPEVTFSIEYWGPKISDETHRDGMADPTHVWTPCIAPSGLLFYTGDRIPAWKGKLLAGGLVLQQIRVLTLEGTTVAEDRTLDIGSRVRDVRQGPDGFVYVLTDEKNGRLLRLEAAP